MARGLPQKKRLLVLNRNLSRVDVMTERGSCESVGIFVGWFERIWATSADPNE